MNKEQIQYIFYKYNQFINLHGECNDFPEEYPNDLSKEGYIIKIEKYEPNNKIIFNYKIINHWLSTEYNNRNLKIIIDDREELYNINDLINCISICKL